MTEPEEVEVELEENCRFSRQMRKATRDVHSISDALVNTKLAFALSADEVWAQGLLIFYEIFKFLEEHVSIDILPPEYHRREAFEDDLSHYLGINWKQSYKPCPEVCKYLQHLEEIHEKEPLLLIAYVYHLYMGLLSGGQILQRKRNLTQKFTLVPNEYEILPGQKLTNFQYYSIKDLKNTLRKIIDDKAKDFNDDLKQALLVESRKVFQLNNEIIGTIKGVNKFVTKISIICLIVLILAWYLYKFFYL